MKFGRLNTRIEIQRATSTRDDWNHETKTWSVLHNIWAHVSQENTTLTGEAGAVSHVMRWKFRVRYLDGLKLTDRVVYDHRTLDIVGWQEVGNREALDIFATLRNVDS